MLHYHLTFHLDHLGLDAEFALVSRVLADALSNDVRRVIHLGVDVIQARVERLEFFHNEVVDVTAVLGNLLADLVAFLSLYMPSRLLCA